MTLITKAQTEQLLANGIAQRAAIDRQDQALDFKPVVKLFTPDAQCTWLLTEFDEGTDLAFGLCDLGLGCPELGYVSLTGHLHVPASGEQQKEEMTLVSRLTRTPSSISGRQNVPTHELLPRRIPHA
jgi:hypothetical protein